MTKSTMRLYNSYKQSGQDRLARAVLDFSEAVDRNTRLTREYVRARTFSKDIKNVKTFKDLEQLRDLNPSGLAYLVGCYKLGLITEEELIRLRGEYLNIGGMNDY